MFCRLIKHQTAQNFFNKKNFYRYKLTDPSMFHVEDKKTVLLK